MNQGECYFKVDDIYYDQLFTPITDPELIAKLNKIKIPVSYTNKTYCPDDKIRGLAEDGKGKVQYFYSDQHKMEATHDKNCNLIIFGSYIDQILEDVQEILTTSNELDEITLHALALKLMTLCHFRPGAKDYVKKYGTYGLTTMTYKQLQRGSKGLYLSFPGKKKQINSCLIIDPVVEEFLIKLNETTQDPDEKILKSDLAEVTADSLNKFIQEYHPDLSTKVWRTWFANISYIEKLLDIGIIPDTKKDRKRLSNSVVKTIAEELHHSMAINKKNYLITELEAMFVDHPQEWVDLILYAGTPKDILLKFLEDYC